MDRTVIEFIKALRGAEVRVSTGESVEMINTFNLLGYADKSQLRIALSLVAAKSEQEKQTLLEVFDQFFSFNRFRSAADEQQLPEDQEQAEADARSPSADGEPPSAQSDVDREQQAAGAGGASSDSMAQSELGQMLLNNDQAAMGMAMSNAGRSVGISNIKMITQRGLYGRRIMQQMGLDDLEQEIDLLQQQQNNQAQALAKRLRDARNLLREDVKDFVAQQLLLHAQEHKIRLRESTMREVKLQHLSEFKDVQLLVRKMAKRLAALHGRRRKEAVRGRLDVRNTLRKNIVHDGILFEPQWQSRRIDRPKVVAICDVSGSVSAVARFLLMFLYSLTEVLPRVRAFAFSGYLGEVTDLFDELELEQAIAETLHQYGMGSTDYGSALMMFKALAMDSVDHNTTVIIMGDARNNYGDACSEVLKEIADRARQIIWLNPESRSRWNTGDSIMNKYQPYCAMAEECNSLNHLERVVSRLLRRSG